MEEWATIVKAISDSKDAYLSIAAAIAILVSILGLRTWKKQLRGKTEYELARRLLRAIYRVRDAIQDVRHPFIWEAEMSEATESLKNNGESLHKDADVIPAVYQMRWRKIQDAMSELSIEALEAEVLWGAKKVKDTINPLRQCVTDLRVDLEDYLHYRHGTKGDLEPGELQRIRKVVFWRSDNPQKDEFTGKLYSAISQIEATVKPFLKL
jgi:hypothetical protein